MSIFESLRRHLKHTSFFANIQKGWKCPRHHIVKSYDIVVNIVMILLVRSSATFGVNKNLQCVQCLKYEQGPIHFQSANNKDAYHHLDPEYNGLKCRIKGQKPF